MRLQLDNGKSYDVNAMLTPKRVGRANAWLAFRSNLSSWSTGLKIPLHCNATAKGCLNWLVVFGLHSLTLLFLPILWLFGYSLKAYTFFTRDDADKLDEYKRQLQDVYRRLSDIEDGDEYQRRLEEEIAKIKPYH